LFAGFRESLGLVPRYHLEENEGEEKKKMAIEGVNEHERKERKMKKENIQPNKMRTTISSLTCSMCETCM